MPISAQLTSGNLPCRRTRKIAHPLACFLSLISRQRNGRLQTPRGTRLPTEGPADLPATTAIYVVCAPRPPPPLSLENSTLKIIAEAWGAILRYLELLGFDVEQFFFFFFLVSFLETYLRRNRDGIYTLWMCARFSYLKKCAFLAFFFGGSSYTAVCNVVLVLISL